MRKASSQTKGERHHDDMTTSSGEKKKMVQAGKESGEGKKQDRKRELPASLDRKQL